MNVDDDCIENALPVSPNDPGSPKPPPSIGLLLAVGDPGAPTPDGGRRRTRFAT